MRRRDLFSAALLPFVGKKKPDAPKRPLPRRVSIFDEDDPVSAISVVSGKDKDRLFVVHGGRLSEVLIDDL